MASTEHRYHAHRAAQPVVLDDAVLARVAGWLAAADTVLIGAGAGLSADAGYDYTDPVSFARRYPRMVERGVLTRYGTFGYRWPSEAVQWGWLARHLDEVRFSLPPDPRPYERLRQITAGHDRFVVTSNADDLFERTGFAPDQIWTRQGSYARMQCLRPCTDATWPTEPWVRAAVADVDPVSEEITEPGLIPRCPRCDGPMMLNVRAGPWFIEDPYLAQRERFVRWFESVEHGRLLVLDIGTGYSTPGVIRWPVEGIVASHPRTTLLRVNPAAPEVPAALGERAIGIAAHASDLLGALATTAR